MLVIRREERETLHIGEAVVIVLSISRGVVRLGIEAPREIKVLRGELVERAVDAGLAEGNHDKVPDAEM